MAQGTRYSPYDTSYEQDYASYDDRYAEPVDLDTFGSQLRSNHPARSLATREEFLPEDSVPLFLSGADEERRSPKFARPRKRGSRLLKAGALAAAALMLAQTYDPTVLGTQDIRNITPDPALARSWYQRAAQLGSPDAQRRLSQLQ